MAKKVIIIDDSPTQLNYLKALFQNDSWEVFCVQNAKIAFEMFFVAAPDLIITDAIMPYLGGFQLVKSIRENDLISSIPTIVYSVLAESNAKYYLKESRNEYFLTKKDNYEELLALANKLIEKFPLSSELKEKILERGDEFIKQKEEINNQNSPTISFEEEKEEEIVEEEPLNRNEILKDLKEKINYTTNSENFFKDFFNVLEPILKYNLAIATFEENREKTIFFDIKDIILSPIFRNGILNKFQAKKYILNKKYAPLSQTILKEEDFLSKIDFEYEIKTNSFFNISFYSLKEGLWQNKENLEIIYETIEDTIKLRHINQKIALNRQKNKNRYLNANSNQSFKTDILLKLENLNSDVELYLGTINITNFSNIKEISSVEEVDFLRTKIIRNIVNYLDKDETLNKDEDDYILLIYAKDEKHAYHKFNYILNLINSIEINSISPSATLGAAKCTKENIGYVKKLMKEALEETNEENKTVIKNDWK